MPEEPSPLPHGPLPLPDAPPLPPKLSVVNRLEMLLAESAAALRPGAAARLSRQRHCWCFW